MCIPSSRGGSARATTPRASCSSTRIHQTSVEGLYAAGDIVRGLNQISVATGGGAIAASAMHLALRELDERASAPAPAPDLVSQH